MFMIMIIDIMWDTEGEEQTKRMLKLLHKVHQSRGFNYLTLPYTRVLAIRNLGRQLGLGLLYTFSTISKAI